jgi:hypothetical protein
MTNQALDSSSTIPKPSPPQPVDESDEAYSPNVGEASAKIVGRSLWMLSVIGAGAFFLMYSSVHAGERQSAKMGGAFRPAATPSGSSFAPARTAAPTPTSKPTTAAFASAVVLTPLDDVLTSAVPTPTKAPLAGSIALAPLGDLLLSAAYEPKPTPNLPPRPIFAAPPKARTIVRIEPDPVTAADANPYDPAFTTPTREERRRRALTTESLAADAEMRP